jgi:hypothetical protein
VLAQDVLNLFRELANDPSNKGRWSDTVLLSYLSEAAQEATRDTGFPQNRYVFSTVAGQQEYQLQFECLRYDRVYVAGQLIVPTSINTLEGRQIQMFDQGRQSGVVPQQPSSGSGGPPGSVNGQLVPAWVDQSPEAYPFTGTGYGFPAPDAAPWTIGQRPRYYTRSLGAVIGLVPAPLAIYTVTIDGLFVPPQITSTTQTLTYPAQFKRLLAWKMLELASYSDNGDRAQQQNQNAAAMYEKIMAKIRRDLSAQDAQQEGPKVLTYRSFYTKGNNRGNSDRYY